MVRSTGAPRNGMQDSPLTTSCDALERYARGKQIFTASDLIWIGNGDDLCRSMRNL